MMHFMLLAVACFVVFTIGALSGMGVAWRRYATVIEDRDAEAKREAVKVAGYMAKGVEFNQSILAILQTQNETPRQLMVDWDLLTQAANGAGFALIKAEPRVTERVN